MSGFVSETVNHSLILYLLRNVAVSLKWDILSNALSKGLMGSVH